MILHSFSNDISQILKTISFITKCSFTASLTINITVVAFVLVDIYIKVCYM